MICEEPPEDAEEKVKFKWVNIHPPVPSHPFPSPSPPLSLSLSLTHSCLPLRHVYGISNGSIVYLVSCVKTCMHERLYTITQFSVLVCPCTPIHPSYYMYFIHLRYPHLACELLTAEVYMIVEKLSSSESLLQLLWSFLDSSSPLDPLVGSFISKVLAMLLNKENINHVVSLCTWTCFYHWWMHVHKKVHVYTYRMQWNLSIKDLRSKDTSLIRTLPVDPAT